ncbi:MAG: 50S ribosomal protein L25 [Desulfomonilaceae bacterium]|nr:50S ribosomal protein L25 [Desulfomonilaceae bacterium]
MNKVALNVEKRSQTGKGPARRLRAAGKAPAVFYGKNIEPIKLSVDVHEFGKIMEKGGRNTLFDLQVRENGGTVNHVAVLKERQVRPVDGALIHVDFLEVFMDEPIQVNVQIDFVGKSIGVENGGLFQPVVRELQISCLPNDIPTTLEIDISDLDVGHSMNVSQMKMPKGVTLLHEDDFVVASVVAPKRLELEEVEAEAEEAAEAAEAETAEAEKSE